MKKSLALTVFLLVNQIFSQSNISFNLDPSGYVNFTESSVPHVVGNFSNDGANEYPDWDPGAIPMTDEDGDGIYSVSISLIDGDYAYKYTLGDWNTQEFWDSEKECLVWDGQYWNRALTVVGVDQDLEFVEWNKCAGEETPESVNITFNLDPSSYVNFNSSSVPYVVGNFSNNGANPYPNWDPGAIPMTDNDGDGIWSTTLSLSDGEYLYKYTLGDWGTQEFWNSEKECLIWDGSYWNRALTVAGADQDLDWHHWNQCAGEDQLGMVTISFQVNTALISDEIETTIYAGGGFLGNAMAVPLSDDDGNGIYTGTHQVTEGSGGNFIYLNSPQGTEDWSAKEDLSGLECADTDNWNDRIIAAVNSDITLTHCFGSCETDGSCPEGNPSLMLKGIIDFNVPSGSFDGRAIHLVVNENIEDLSSFGIGIANNGGGTDGQEYTLPSISVYAGQHILVARSYEAMNDYMGASEIYDHIFIDDEGIINGGGDDAVELFGFDEVIDTFGDVNSSGLGQEWEYTDSWAYNINGDWTFGGVNCTDGSSTTCESNCVYPFAYCGDSFNLYSENGLRLQYESLGYRAVSPGDAFGSNGAWFWQAEPYNDFFETYNNLNPQYPNTSNQNNGLVDDIMYFFENGNFTYDTGEDGTIMGKKDEIDTAFDPTGEFAYEADNDVNEYFNYPQGDFSDTFSLGNDGTYNTIEFTSIGALGMYTSTGEQVYQILEQTANTIYVRNIGSEGNAWYSLLTTDAHTLSTNQVDILDVFIYPNPVVEKYVTILSPVHGPKKIQVFDVTGREVISALINNNYFDITPLNSGLYLIKVSISGKSRTSKIIIK